MKKVFAVLLLLAWTGMGVMAQIPNGYYNNANGKTGDELKVALHNIIKGHHVVSYSGLLDAFPYTDNDGNGNVWDIYSNCIFSYSGNALCGDYQQEGDCWNREHTWPQSWFNEQTTPRSDLFHVYPTDGYVNEIRSNYPYGEVNNPIYTSGNGSKLGPCVTSGYSGRVFEPVDEYKGDIARSYFYMSVRYYSEDSIWDSSGMTNKSEILPWAMTMLLRWSDEDPVSDKEIARNNAVYGFQNNRNPFIDHPEYARMIWDENWQGGGNIGNGDFVKVTSADEITDGDYLIVCENNNVAFNGALTTLDAVGNTIDITITGGVIASSETTNAAVFTIASLSDNVYSIKSSSGRYIGQTSNNNGLVSSSTTVYDNTISMNNGDVDIVSSGAYLRYNANSDQRRFRYFKSSTYTNRNAIQLYKKMSLYSITFAPVAHGNISASAETAVEGATITLSAVPDPCYAFTQWEVTDAQGNVVNVTENQFEMPASNVTVNAIFSYSPQSFTQEYQLVTSADQLVLGRTYLIVNVANGKALGTTQNSNNRSASAVTIEDDIIPNIGNTVCELTLGGSTGIWTFFDASWGTNGGYLYAASSDNNYLRTQANNTNNGKWSITIGTGGAATIQSQGNYTHNLLKYNNSSTIFSCYASGSTQLDVCLFRRTEIEDYPAEQVVNLEEGWNWWAPTIEITRNDLETALGFSLNALPDQLFPGQMYKIETAASLSAPVSGVYVASPEVTIEPGCNWIGYYGAESPIATLFNSGFVPASGDKIISQDEGFAIYGSNGWNGTLTVLRPGHGYVYVSNTQGNRTLSFR